MLFLDRVEIMSSNFFIKNGYVLRRQSQYFDDDLFEQEKIIHQPEVYQFGKYLANKFGCKYIIDIGCGHAKKLINLYPDFQILGIDYKNNIEYCKNN